MARSMAARQCRSRTWLGQEALRTRACNTITQLVQTLAATPTAALLATTMDQISPRHSMPRKLLARRWPVLLRHSKPLTPHALLLVMATALRATRHHSRHSQTQRTRAAAANTPTACT